MPNTDIFLGSGASLTFVPETDIYVPISVINTQNVITVATAFSDDYRLVKDLYVGCVIEYYDNGTFTSSHRITANTATTITFSPAISSSITVNTSQDYFHIRGYGAPVPGPGDGSTSIHTAQVLSIKFNSDTKANYDNDSISFGQVPSSDGATSTAYVIGLTNDGSYGGATANLTVDISDADITTAEEVIDVIVAEVAKTGSIHFSASRSGDSLVLTNTFGGTVSQSLSVSDSTNMTKTTTTAGASVTTAATARLLADEWLGILESATFPTTEVEMKQVNLSLGGSRNFTYQYKGIETASGANLGIVANHAAWLYYFLGKCTTISATSATESLAAGDEFTAQTSGATYFDAGAHVETGPIFYRSVGTVICPPILKGSDALANMDKLTVPGESSGNMTNGITYTFAEQDTDNLPSFAIEQVFSKLPSSNTYRTETASADESLNFVKIARGNRVNTLTLSANENEEIKMTLDLNSRAVHSLEQTESYDARRGVTDETTFFNYGSQPTFLEPFFFSRGYFKIFGQQFLKINSLTLTMNNNLQDRRFIGVGNTSIKEGIPAQRTYELQFTGHVTDDKLYTELLSRTGDNTASGEYIELQFEKANGENFNLKFTDYQTSAVNFPIPDDKGPVVVEATVMPRTLQSCTAVSHWILQG